MENSAYAEVFPVKGRIHSTIAPLCRVRTSTLLFFFFFLVEGYDLSQCGEVPQEQEA